MTSDSPVDLLGPSLLAVDTSKPVPADASHVWEGVGCDGCSATPIEGRRFKCSDCNNYDLCEACHSNAATVHPDHTFDEVKIPEAFETKTVSTQEALAGKYIGLYFSAHWCPPCKMFTPRLAEYYNSMVAKGTPFEIVFVSSDSDQKSFDEYFSQMPWLALPYENRDTKNALSRKYKVEGIPTLVILDEHGNSITKDARSKVMGDPEGLGFPYAPRPLSEMLGNVFVNREGEKFDRSDIDGKILGLYFSASWCGPCRRCTPLLATLYEKLKAKQTNFEIVFLSGDKDEEAFTEYIKEMPWLALPFKHAKSAYEELSDFYGVDGIPSLVILDENRKIINKDAASVAMNDKDGVDFPWAPKNVVDLAEGIESAGFSINEKPALVAFFPNESEDEKTRIRGVVQTLANQRSTKVVCTGDTCTMESVEPDTIFFTVKETSGMSERVASICSISEEELGSPFVLILDVPQRQFHIYRGSIEVNTLADLISQYNSGSLETTGF
ncbi:thioredoxin-like-domain-containing protein [Polychytrium aggregatum]|uniref:thioredoxin-like-domain-containing protein n=1 Tax=Polychytrium aggregatum TaxID=110093 RepID=UPI0022FDEBAB|nr:thioredoxin-like-domain-containing protein [Polychytrium aggregatum]KAI9205742.1 thioredoxin-like-domain-containing protein [Polychytrium aggregatum]